LRFGQIRPKSVRLLVEVISSTFLNILYVLKIAFSNKRVNIVYTFYGLECEEECPQQGRAGALNSVLTIKQLFSISNTDVCMIHPRLDAVKFVDMVRLTNDAWLTEREKMIKTCSTKN